MRTIPFLAACIALAPLTGGCFHLGTSTSGSQNNVSFAYASCFFGCAVDAPMMLGTSETILIEGGDIPGVSVASSDPSVLSVKDASRGCCDPNDTCTTIDASTACPAGTKSTSLTVDVQANAVGTANLVLDRADGSLYDSASFEVARAASLALTCGNQPTPSLRVGQSCAVGWTATDAQGRDLQASTGVALTTSDVTVAGFQRLLGAPVAATAGDQGLLGSTIVGVAPGDATFSGTTGDTSASMIVHVVP